MCFNIIITYKYSYISPLYVRSRNVFLFDKMSAMIKDLLSFSLSIKSMYDINSMEFGLVKHSDEHELFLHGSSKLLVRSEGDKGTHYLSFTGDTLTYYSHDQNQYG